MENLRYFVCFLEYSCLFLTGCCVGIYLNIVIGRISNVHSVQYLLVKGLAGMAAVCTAGKMGFTNNALVTFIASCTLIVISGIDWKTMIIPDRCVLVLVLLAVVSIFTNPSVTLLSRFTGIFAVSVPMAAAAYFIPRSFGGGDIKLMAASGFLLGTGGILLAVFIGVVAGGLYAFWLLASGRAKRKSLLAFGPFLSAGIWVSMVWGSELLHWYLGFLW